MAENTIYDLDPDLLAALCKSSGSDKASGSTGLTTQQKIKMRSGLYASSKRLVRSLYANPIWDLGNGVTQTRSNKMRIDLPCDGSGLRVAFIGSHKRGSSWQGVPAALTVKCGVDINGTITPLTVNGSKTITVQPGGLVYFDDFYANLKTTDTIFLRIYCDAGTGNLVPYVRNFLS